MLNTMSAYNLPADYVKQEEAFVKGLTVEKELALANKYIDPSRMYYVVVGDANTQLKDLEKVGSGETDSCKIRKIKSDPLTSVVANLWLLCP